MWRSQYMPYLTCIAVIEDFRLGSVLLMKILKVKPRPLSWAGSWVCGSQRIWLELRLPGTAQVPDVRPTFESHHQCFTHEPNIWSVFATFCHCVAI